MEKQVKISNYLNSKRKEVIFKRIPKSEFSYCPLVLMFTARKSKNLIDKVLERSVRIVSGKKN